MSTIKILVVVDGDFSLLKKQDASDKLFTITELISTFNSCQSPNIFCDTAHRRTDPGDARDPAGGKLADYENFNFATSIPDLTVYDQIWLFGYEGTNVPNHPGSLEFITEDELLVLVRFMDAGGGIFAAGDHSGMGSLMCGLIPRVRSMRKWFSDGDVDPRIPAAAPRNWPGSGSARADTLQPTAAGTYHFDNQSDDIGQPIYYPPHSPVHPILQIPRGRLEVFPDHMHEGEVMTPWSMKETLTFKGHSFIEYPTRNGTQEPPVIIAEGKVIGGHMSPVEGANCGSFYSDTTSTVGKTISLLCAYDGLKVGVGRVVTDSSFHHYIDLNLIKDPCGEGASQNGLPPAVLADLKAFYINMVTWLAPPGKNAPVAASRQFGVSTAQTDVFSIDRGGNLNVAWVVGAGGWAGPLKIGRTGVFPRGAPVATSQHFGVSTAQTDVFAVDTTGALNVAWVVKSGDWSGPERIGSQGVFPPGAYVAAAQQFLLPQTDVFAVDGRGTLNVAWSFRAGAWQGPMPIGPPGRFPPGAPLAVSQQFGLHQTDVFIVDNHGTLNVMWVVEDGQWSGPQSIGPAGLFRPGAFIAVSQQFGVGVSQTDVFVVDKNGTLNVMWVVGAGPWNGPLPIGPAGMFPPGAPVAASQQIGLDQTDVFVVDKNGTLNVMWVVGAGPWSGPLTIGPAGSFRQGTCIAASQQFGISQTDVFAYDKHGHLVVAWVVGTGNWAGPQRIT